MIKVAFSKLNDEQKIKHKSILINCLEKIVSICQENDLNYILSYGSCLGAIRHKGIIPWDDDIDLCMPRPDYDKFCNICNNVDLGDFEVYSIDKTPFYYEHHIRFGYKYSTMLFSVNRPCMMGVFIDIFPADGVESESKAHNNYFKFTLFDTLLHMSHSYYKKSFKIERILHGDLYVLFSAIIGFCRSFWQKYSLRNIKKICYESNYNTSDYISCYISTYYKKNIIPRRWLDETIIVPFEKLTVKVPKDYDGYLSHFYGNWRKLPPENKRDDMHIVDYLNLDRKVTIEEVLYDLKTNNYGN